MSYWHYKRGEWKWLSELPRPYQERTDLEVLSEMGFKHEEMHLHPEESFNVQVYYSDDEGVGVGQRDGHMVTAEFVAVVGMAVHSFVIFVENLPSLILLLGELRHGT